MRLAAQAAVFDALAAQAAGASPRLRPADQLARLERLAELVTQLRHGGMSQQAALTRGLQIIEAGEASPQPSARFAGIYGDAP